MQLRRRHGFTLVELLVVIGIITLLAALGFAVSAPAREKARQAVCVNQLKQIYTAVILYSQDHEGSPTMPQQPQITFMEGNVWEGLQPYVRSNEILYCPDYPQNAKSESASSYEWRWLAFSPRMAADDKWYARLLKDYERRADTYPMMLCKTHDEFFYAPNEQGYDQVFVASYTIELRFDGSVRSGRSNVPRKPR